jgi:transcriptional regulator with XRE-family HTH domain
MGTMNPGKLIKLIREKKNWSQQQLANKIGSTQSMISLWERGGNMRTVDLERCLNGLGYELVARKIRKEGTDVADKTR